MATPPFGPPPHLLTPPARIGAVLFDAYGTLFDVHSVGQLAGQLFPGHGEALTQLWRDKQIEYTRLVTMSSGGAEHYRPFWQVTRDALRWSCVRLGLAADAAALERLMDEYRRLRPFAENLEVLRSLKERRTTAGILSNGDPEMLAAVIAHAGFAQLLHPVLSVQSVRRFKTDAAAYALGPAALGLPAREILFVSSNAWDAVGATWFGYTTLWINRSGAPPEELGTSPTHVGNSLHDVLPLLPSSA
ncbi:MAG: haloacid dehalogenase type II [Rubrivivax sp.]|nr:haloacid dehalogenase type II [Rubrivivax sp.]